MGTYNKGILGAFSGKVGTVVGANWRGMDIMRSLPKKTDRTPTETQLVQRIRFTTVSKFLTPLKAVTSLYYGVETGEKSKVNQAASYHLKEATKFVGNDCLILFNKVQVSKGVLLGIQVPTAVPVANARLQFAWSDNSGQGTAKETDRLFVVVYEPVSKLSEIFFNTGNRGDAVTEIILPAYLSGTDVHCWIGFASENDRLYSTSVYMGEIGIL